MKPETTLPTSTPVRILDPEEQYVAESNSNLLGSLERSLQMNFTIHGEDFVFTLTVDGDGQLTGFTATNGSTTFDCSIQLVSQANERWCCIPNGPCSPGGC
jgi:hypothetical protein